MIAGLPVGTWVLLLAAVGTGLALQLAAWWAHRGGGGHGEERRRDPWGGGAE